MGTERGGSRRFFLDFGPWRPFPGPAASENSIRGEKLRRMDPGRGPGTHFERILVRGGARGEGFQEGRGFLEAPWGLQEASLEAPEGC